MAPKGEGTSVAYSVGTHPFMCEALQHGKNSQLLHKLHHASTLKLNMIKLLSQKHCSKNELEEVPHGRKLENVVHSKKIVLLSTAKKTFFGFHCSCNSHIMGLPLHYLGTV